ncbi:MAG TPA: hypothetical protein VJI46_06450 [Candidatus Nanoarchaeia archaeon]|nr:hypothetical protein [Candidatus Nanoarchaeia archaeon]
MEEIERTFLEEYIGAKDEMKKERYKNATILYSKSIFALCDLLISQKLSKLPKNHSERFRLLEEYFPDVYSIVDAIFTHYTDAYSKPVLKETCEKIQDGIKKIAKNNNVPEGVKKAVG